MSKLGCFFLSKTVLFTLLLLFQFPAFAQGSKLVYTNKIYYEGIRTVQIYPSSNQRGLPIVRLGGERINLSFDDMYEGAPQYNYTLIHCNADWTPSDIMKSEYIKGYQEYFITDFDYSFNTFMPYTHFELQLPNENMQFTKSGNYLLVIFEDNVEEPVITRRFMVYEPRVNIDIHVRRPVELDLMHTHQQVHFEVNFTGYEIPDPSRDFKVTIMQNNRWDNRLMGLQPQFQSSDKLIYRQDKGNTFPGGNEFRFFDTKNLMVLTQNIRKIEIDSIFQVYLAQDPLRFKGPYVFWYDINGQYVVRRQDVENSHVSADYAMMDFMLESPFELPGDVYIFGQLSDWEITEEFKMTYNPERLAYEAKALIKQGYYNYEYVIPIKKNSSDRPHVSRDFTEGNFWETENEYHVLTYHREMGIRYDRLVGYARKSFGGDN